MTRKTGLQNSSSIYVAMTLGVGIREMLQLPFHTECHEPTGGQR
jgi:hypothetical protein